MSTSTGPVVADSGTSCAAVLAAANNRSQPKLVIRRAIKFGAIMIYQIAGLSWIPVIRRAGGRTSAVGPQQLFTL